MSIGLYVCETCETFSPDAPGLEHLAHKVIVLTSTGDDWNELARIAARHFVMAKRILTNTVDNGTLPAELHEATMKADWFSEEDAIYDQEA